MIRRPLKKKWSLTLNVLSIVIMLAVYTWLSHRQHNINPDDTTIPTWGQLKEGIKKISTLQPRNDEIWIVADSKATATRLFSGLGVGITGALFIGIFMGCSRKVEALFMPCVSILAKLPPTAMLPIFFMLPAFFPDMESELIIYVSMLVFGILPTLSQSIYLGVKDIPDELVHKAYTLGASNSEVIWNIIFPNVLPKMIDSIRLQIGPAMVYLIAAELISSDVGFGYRIRLQSRMINMEVVYPYLACLGFFGYSMDKTLKLTSKFLCPWAVK